VQEHWQKTVLMSNNKLNYTLASMLPLFNRAVVYFW